MIRNLTTLAQVFNRINSANSARSFQKFYLEILVHKGRFLFNPRSRSPYSKWLGRLRNPTQMGKRTLTLHWRLHETGPGGRAKQIGLLPSPFPHVFLTAFKMCVFEVVFWNLRMKTILQCLNISTRIPSYFMGVFTYDFVTLILFLYRNEKPMLIKKKKTFVMLKFVSDKPRTRFCGVSMFDRTHDKEYMF